MTTSSYITSLFLVLGAACSSNSDSNVNSDASASTNDPQLPPTSGADVNVWLAAGYYKSWHCEMAAHEARAPSPHGRNRICNNDTIRNAGSSGAYPVGAASTKEHIDDSGAIVGYSVYRKLSEGTDGSNWYWFEIVGGDVGADGTGGSGSPKTVCVSCHLHAPRDFVYTAVP